MTRAAMLAPFADEELHHFEGRGGRQMTYVEDETVMDRLDLGYGPGNWSIQVEAVPYVEGAVKVILLVKVNDDDWVRFEDFGYPNNKGGQELKEAVSDGIRRCGRYIGIARDLYRKDDNTRSAAPVGRPAPPQRPVTPARPHIVDTSVADVADEDWLPPADAAPPRSGGTDMTTCPIHDVPWVGTAGDLWHKDPEGRYCRHPDNIRKARAR